MLLAWEAAAVTIDLAQNVGIVAQHRIDLEDHVILGQGPEHGGDLALAERVIQRLVDRVHGDAVGRGGLAIDIDGHLQAGILPVVGHVGQFGLLAQRLHQPACSRCRSSVSSRSCRTY